MPIARLLRCLLLTLIPAAALAQWQPLNPIKKFDIFSDNLTFHLAKGAMRIQFYTDSMVRVRYSPTDTFSEKPEYVIARKEWPKVDWKWQANQGGSVTLSTARFSVTVIPSDGTIFYRDNANHQLLLDGGRQLTPVQVNGESTFRAETFFNVYGSPEGLYGLGQHQAGVFNYRGESVDLSQDNTNIAVPLFVSSRGWGVFWNNPARSRFNNRFLHYLYLSSEVADDVDYYFLYGPDLDHVVAGYRELTGQAPLFGKWAYGFWQCKNRYASQEEILGVARKYRELHIPVDNIVQDWFWWNRKGEHVFNKNYPDPKGMLDTLHRENFHLMLSVWPFFEPGSKEYAEMDAKGWFLDKTKMPKPPYHADKMAVYDASNPEARAYYWKLMEKPLFGIGVDAWWMDTTEPETEGQEENIQLGHQLSIGSGDRFANLFPLNTTAAVYQGQRKASSDKRVFILSRSAFAGSQRNAVTAWSGDINSDWESFKRQIPAGLNFSLSGLPYWTTDIGGFVSGNPDDPAYRELFVRWFEYGAFCPVFRVHGTRTTNQNELWSYGPDAQQILTRYDRLRYRLMPYIYSLAWQVTSNSYTPMRPLIMDFPSDPRVTNLGDQFLYGPAFLVNPVTEPGATTRHLYLPQATWYDFWSGEHLTGGRAIDAAAPLDRMPLYVRAGSIVPLGPDEEYASQKPADPIELRIYPGADGHFTLYEDEGDSYRYEQGQYATIPLDWNDATQTLTLGTRQGSFPGMLQARTFRVVFVSPGQGAGPDPATSAKTITYEGKELSLKK